MWLFLSCRIHMTGKNLSHKIHTFFRPFNLVFGVVTIAFAIKLSSHLFRSDSYSPGQNC